MWLYYLCCSWGWLSCVLQVRDQEWFCRVVAQYRGEWSQVQTEEMINMSELEEAMSLPVESPAAREYGSQISTAGADVSAPHAVE